VTLPNFLLLGTAKAGTTSMFRYLELHPEVFGASPKEPKFFAYENEDIRFQGPGDQIKNWLMVTRLEAYQALFAGVTNQKAIGEATAFYLYVPKAAERIRYHVPQAKLIAILRDPADRAYSAYLHLVRDGREPVHNFAQALQLEQSRIAQNYQPAWHYRSVGYYYAQIKRYYDLFPRQQMRIFLYEDLKTNPLKVLKEVFQFLEIDDSFVPDLGVRHNVGAFPRNWWLEKFMLNLLPLRRKVVPRLPRGMRWRVIQGLKKLERWNRIPAPPLPVDIRAQLVAGYEEDILRLQDLLGRDLSAWLRVEPALRAELSIPQGEPKGVPRMQK
jgi:sulfotransferase family protein